jgi:thioredoxin reductase (NADPH)
VEERGGDQPDSLHPSIDLGACMGSGRCVEVCPEKDVIVIKDGQATVANASRCVGHGLCERACPTDAIDLVLGTEQRGVDIPRIQGNFETNMDGIYVIGELSGIGRIRNAFEQASQCIDGLMAEQRDGPAEASDLLIVGCGPAGLAASLWAHYHDLSFVTIEKEDIGGTVRTYPRKKMVMTHPVQVPGYGTLDVQTIQKEELIELWEEIVAETGIRSFINTGETFKGAEQVSDGTYTVNTTGGTYRTQRVVLAIGRRGVPRKLGIPGEDQSHVAYSLMEPERYIGDRITIVGGGDSAVEAALSLAEHPGTDVRLSYRRDEIYRPKPQNIERIEAAIAEGDVAFLPETNLTEIREESVVYRDAEDGLHTLPTDSVFIFIGGVLPTDMIEDLGVEIDTKFGEPVSAP